MRIYTLLFVALMPMSIYAEDTKVETFWKWFKQNQDEVFKFEKDTKAVFDRLGAAMERVHEGLPVRSLPLIDPTMEAPRIVNEIDNLVNDVSNSLLGDLFKSLFGAPRR